MDGKLQGPGISGALGVRGIGVGQRADSYSVRGIV